MSLLKQPLLTSHDVLLTAGTTAAGSSPHPGALGPWADVTGSFATEEDRGPARRADPRLLLGLPRHVYGDRPRWHPRAAGF